MGEDVVSSLINRIERSLSRLRPEVARDEVSAHRRSSPFVWSSSFCRRGGRQKPPGWDSVDFAGTSRDSGFICLLARAGCACRPQESESLRESLQQTLASPSYCRTRVEL
jgi:hypothetical protein